MGVQGYSVRDVGVGPPSCIYAGFDRAVMSTKCGDSGSPAGHVVPGSQQPPVLIPLDASARFELDPASLVQQRITAVVRNFDVTLPTSDPQLLECFRTRNTRWNAASLALTVPWTGEYPGKWLTHCAELWPV